VSESTLHYFSKMHNKCKTKLIWRILNPLKLIALPLSVLKNTQQKKEDPFLDDKVSIDLITAIHGHYGKKDLISESFKK
jgi:hypothetical protein